MADAVEDGYTAGICIDLTMDFWLVAMTSLKHNRIKRFKICGNNPLGYGTSQLSPKDLKRIIRGAIRFKCSVFIFSRIDFGLFKDITYSMSLPVTSVHFERCMGVDNFISQIPNTNLDPSLNGYNYEDRVRHISFFACFSTLTEVKSQIVSALEKNYRLSGIDHIISNRTITDKNKAYNDELNLCINKLLRRNVVCRLVCQESILTLIMVRRFRTNTTLNCLPKEIVLMVARMLWKTKEEYCHMLGIDGKISSSAIESKYNEYQLPRGNIPLLNIIFNGSNHESMVPLKELKRKKITLDKLIISTEEYVSGAPTDDIRFGFMLNLFHMLVSTNVKILEIHNMDFDEDTIMREPDVERENLDGDDSRIGNIRSPEYPELKLTEVHLVKCSNVYHFISTLLGIVDKARKPEDERFSYNGMSLESIESDITYSISLFIDRRMNTIYIEQSATE